MKINQLMGWPALLTIAAGFLGGCAVEPVREYSARRVYIERPAFADARVVRRIETRPTRTIRYRSLPAVGERTYIRGYRSERFAPIGERTFLRRTSYGTLAPVGERLEIDTRGTRTRWNDRYYRYHGWRTEPVVPFGPNSPVSPSQWY